MLTLDPMLEQRLLESLRPGDGGAALALPAPEVEALADSCAERLLAAERTGRSPVLVCSPALRPALHRMLAAGLPRLPVLSYGEVGGQAQDRDDRDGDWCPPGCCLKAPRSRACSRR